MAIKRKKRNGQIYLEEYKSGAVTLLWKIASELGYIEIIDEICCENPNTGGPSPGKLLTAWAINRVIDPMSNTILENWILTTDLPKLMKLNQSPTISLRCFSSALPARWQSLGIIPNIFSNFK